MRLREVYLKNFRSYQHEVRVPISDLTSFIGKNDIGKSTILEALEIFFNNESVKIDAHDPCVDSGAKEVEIGCIFEGFPESLVIDSSAETNLEEEYLLNSDGLLEIRKIFNCGLKTPKSKVVVWAKHPSADGVEDLLQLKIADLKKRADKLKITDADFGVKSSIRKAIWRHSKNLDLKPAAIEVDSEDAAAIWEKLEKCLPTYALFKSDRASRDEDDEVQDPMKIAVKAAIKSLEPELKRIKETVQEQVLKVAEMTLEKLHEMDPNLASQLNPTFRSEPKWDGIFNLSLTGESDIPINKRGSGVRRLILLNFFRAEAERRNSEKHSPGIIYAVEEPETSQHPNNQRMLASALLEISRKDNCQVLLTTHVPGFAGLLPTGALRHIRPKGENPRIVVPDEDGLNQLASDLGVFPDNKVKLLLFVEGSNDVSFFQRISKKLSESDPSYINFFTDPRVAFVPVGGSSLKEWVEKRFLREFRRPEFHFYDCDDPDNPAHRQQCEEVNARGDGSFAVLTTRREIENYIPRAGIERILNLTLPDYDPVRADVPEIVARAIHESSEAPTAWESVQEEKRKKKISNAKRRLNNEVMDGLTLGELQAEDVAQEVSGWIRRVSTAVTN